MKNGITFNVEDIIPLYYEDESGKYEYLGKVSEFEADISDIVEPTEVDGQFVKKIKLNQDYSFSVEISNVDKEALMKAFIEPYIQYCFERDLMNSYIKSYMDWISISHVLKV